MQEWFKQSLALLKRFLNVKYFTFGKVIILGGGGFLKGYTLGGGGTNNDKMLIWTSKLSQHLQALKTDILTTLTCQIW